MLRGIGFEIMIASPSDHDELVAEIYFDGLFVAMVSQERGRGAFELEIPGADLDESQIVRRVSLAGFRKIVDDACLRLSG